MVDSSADFEAFYEQERAKASRVLPPSSSYGLTTAPSRHLIFAKTLEEERTMLESVTHESESTLHGDAVVP